MYSGESDVLNQKASKQPHRKLTECERDRMLDIYAMGPLTYRPKIDDPLLELDLIEFYDITRNNRSVQAKHSEDLFYAQDGNVLPEWYGRPLSTVRVRISLKRDVYYKIPVKNPKDLDEVKEAMRSHDAGSWEQDPDFYEHLGDSYWDCVGEIKAEDVEEIVETDLEEQ